MPCTGSWQWAATPGDGCVRCNPKMTEIKVGKIEVARRQIELSIRLLFQNEDPIGVHTLTAAGFRILHDLGRLKPNSQINEYLKKIIKPGMEGKFWQRFNRAANFFKHAERDPADILENVQEEANDVLILFACFYYKDIGYQWTLQMVAFVTWYMVLHPEIIKLLIDDPTTNDLVADEEFSALRQKPRPEQLSFGRILIERAYVVIKSI